MRHYIRHPFDVSIDYQVDNGHSKLDEQLKNISRGGLCLTSPTPIEEGSHIHVSIPVQQPPFEFEGVVMWCHEHDGYEVGIKFKDESNEYALRMVEQACHIQHYKQQILESEGRELSTNEAAEEWIAKYAGEFPR